MEQLVLLLVIAAISLVNWLIERSKKLREQRRFEKEAANRGQSPRDSQPELPAQSPREEIEENLRRMLESFGLPVEEPKPFLHQPAPGVVFEEPPPPPPLPKPQPSTPRPSLRRTKPSTTALRPRSPWLSRLNSPQGLREAVVLREILGPPKAVSDL